MLNLITAQVCCCQITTTNTAPVAGLAQLCTRALMPSARQLPVTSDMFTIALLDPVLSVYNQSVYKVVHNRLASMSENKMCLPVMSELRKFLPHCTPLKSDIIVYASVEKAHSANKDDVTGYLTKLKEALKINSPDFPNCIVLCGDQQTYSIIVQLKKSHPTMFSWYYPLPGNWHLMKLTSEVIRDIIWDGGLKQFCSACGIKGELSQWQDIHIMLLSAYEVLLEISTNEYNATQDVIKVSYWEWLESLTQPSNTNEVSRFWSQVLIVLHYYSGFYFSIRSGNWYLRNAFLKALSPIFLLTTGLSIRSCVLITCMMC